MKFIVFIIIYLSLPQISFAQNTDSTACLKYHKGKFTYTDSANNLIQLTRKKHYQVERNTVTNVWVNYRITWKNDCEYELRQVGTNSKVLRKYNGELTTTIIKNATADDGYEYICGCRNDMPKEPDFMRKVKNFYAEP